MECRDFSVNAINVIVVFFIICVYVISLQGPQVHERQLTNDEMPSLVCFPWHRFIHLLQKSSQHFTKTVLNPASTVMGRLSLITKSTSSLVWSCRYRYFVDATTVSTVKTVTKMMRMIGEKKMCAQRMAVAIFPGQNNG